jgi:uncharacterized metal-binding protein
MYNCTNCGLKGCSEGNLDKTLPNCPSKEKKIKKEAKKLYLEEENYKIAHNAAIVEAEGYGAKTRVEEIISFAKKCRYKRIGLVFCIGLTNEAKCFSDILRHHGFDIISVLCKNGSIEKSYIGIGDENKIEGQCDEIMCNPIGQALLLNEHNTDFNVILGLCVGHDTLVMKYLKAPMTTLAVKDRVTGHNPLVALYLSDSYYKRKLY